MQKFQTQCATDAKTQKIFFRKFFLDGLKFRTQCAMTFTYKMCIAGGRFDCNDEEPKSAEAADRALRQTHTWSTDECDPGRKQLHTSPQVKTQDCQKNV